jgi:hypothetical protein
MVELDRFQRLARKMPTDDREATALLFEGIVAPLRLPAVMNGQPFSKSRPKWMN